MILGIAHTAVPENPVYFRQLQGAAPSQPAANSALCGVAPQDLRQRKTGTVTAFLVSSKSPESLQIPAFTELVDLLFGKHLLHDNSGNPENEC